MFRGPLYDDAVFTRLELLQKHNFNIERNANQVKCWFLRRGETGVPGENLSLQSREPTNATHI